MSRRHELQDGTGVLQRKSPTGVLHIVQATTPTNSQAGFAVGCIWQNTAGTVGSALYVNVGSNTSSTWVNVA